jgi:hypothetical protein
MKYFVGVPYYYLKLHAWLSVYFLNHSICIDASKGIIVSCPVRIEYQSMNRQIEFWFL